MIETNIGNVCILINGKTFDYKSKKLPNKGKQFIVDGRYQVVVDKSMDCNDEDVIDCILNNTKSLTINGYSESGEQLALISFMYNNFKLSIGLEGDIPGVYYEYLNDRLRVRITKYASIKNLKFNVAWLTMQDIGKEEIYTWFAADPTLGQI